MEKQTLPQPLEPLPEPAPEDAPKPITVRPTAEKQPKETVLKEPASENFVVEVDESHIISSAIN